jgi:hypothetical protein
MQSEQDWADAVMKIADRKVDGDRGRPWK